MVKKQKVAEVLKRKIKENGLRLTSTRKTILDVIIESKTDLTAEEIFINAHRKDTGIGIATVYRTTNLFEEFNLVNIVPDSGNRKKYRYIKKAGLKAGRQPVTEKPLAAKLKSSNSVEFQNLNADAAGSYDNTEKGLYKIDKITRLQFQINEWNRELSKIKNEKEMDLEEIINDFSKLDRVLERHQYEKNNLIQMLLDFQSEYSWLPKHVLFYVGKKIDVPLSQVYSIASFYKFFNLVPKGKYQVVVCAGTACHVRGSVNLLQRIVNILNIKPGDTTPDYRFTLDTVNCLGCCALGPVMLFGKKYYSDPSAKQLERLFENTI
ncbi:MAG: hypothetical protein FJW66_03710 [Actinobacteria bacterium]|nr:hypothetical protein [Actinomycetota bacterium]